MIANLPVLPNVGHVFIANTIGGCESCSRMVMQHAADSKHHVLFFSEPGEATGMLQGFAASVTHRPISSRNFKAYRDGIRAWAEQHQLDGAILWHGMVALPPLIQGLELAGCRILVHGGNPCLQTSLKQDLKFLLLEKLFPSQALPTYFSCSEYVASSYQRSRYLRRFPKAVIHNGVALQASTPTTEQGLSKEVTVGMTARLDRGKDHAAVLRAVAQALPKAPTLKLEFLGDGSLREELEQLAQNLGIAHAVSFLGTQREVSRVMERWDIFAYATTDAEGFGNSLVEAMSLGLPCVVHDVGPMAEVVGQPPRAWIIPRDDTSAFAEALVSLAHDPARRQRLGEDAQQFAIHHYSPSTYAAKVIALLGEQPRALAGRR